MKAAAMTQVLIRCGRRLKKMISHDFVLEAKFAILFSSSCPVVQVREQYIRVFDIPASKQPPHL